MAMKFWLSDFSNLNSKSVEKKFTACFPRLFNIFNIRFLSSLLLLMSLASASLFLTNCQARLSQAQTFRPVNLRTELKVNPLGLDTPAPRLSWNIEASGRNFRQSAYQILVSSSLAELAADRGTLWDSGKVQSDETVLIPYSGAPLTSGQRCFWKVRLWDENGRASDWSQPAFWEMALLHPDDWKARWIYDGQPTPTRDEEFYRDDPAPLFRKVFAINKKPVKARLYITGLGYYEAYLNGRRLGDHWLDPGWTDYADRVLYSTYDVTLELQPGENCLGAILGNGWYNPLPLRMWGRLNLREHLTVGRPCLLAQLEIFFADGTSATIVSDTSWKVHKGPILRNNIYLGEVYDARQEIPGWNRPGFDDSNWSQAKLASPPGGRLQAQSQPPIKIKDEIYPVRLSEPRPGVFIFDLGENFAGTVRLRLKAPRGTKIQLRYGELLYPDGTLNPMTSVCGQIKGLRRDGTPVGGPGAPEIAVQQDVYVCRGEGEEVYVPRFTFHGFRYVEVTGLAEQRPAPRMITGLRLQADVEPVGVFECSDPLFNQIQAMCRRTFLSNLFSVQSDCPHRERFGYGGDIVASSEAVMMNFDLASFYAKAVRDEQDASFPDGMLTDTAPFVGIQYCGVGWAMVHPWLLNKLYQYYGDRKLVEEQYQVSRRWLELVKQQYPDHIVTDGLGDHESLENPPLPIITTSLYAETARLMERLAEILGKKEDALRYQNLFSAIDRAFLERFYVPGAGEVRPVMGTEEGQAEVKQAPEMRPAVTQAQVTQAGQALALALNLLPPEERGRALEVLVKKIREENRGHLATGIFGTKYLLEVLSQAGQAELAAEIVRQKTFPGWGYMIERGATTLWEHWEFSDNTYSHNHQMFGSVSAWFFRWLAGIQPHPEAKGFDRFIIRPQPVKGLSWVKAEYKSVRGTIQVAWKKEENRFLLRVVIPANTRAMVFMPTSDVKSIREITEAGEARLSELNWQEGEGYAVCELGSGTYTFSTH
jgi:alpha-L-rhamnosidase